MAIFVVVIVEINGFTHWFFPDLSLLNFDEENILTDIHSALSSQLLESYTCILMIHKRCSMPHHSI